MSWVDEVKGDLELRKKGNVSTELGPFKKRSIYKVPTFIADLNKKVYSPHAVSFGPYHHGEPPLKPVESHKKRSLLHFLENRAKVPLETIFDSFTKVEKELKDSYDSLDPKWQSDQEGFLKLMIVDGCFMLEIFRAAIQTPADYDAEDPIFGNHGKLHIMPFIKRDMLMLENQLPMLVLHNLLAISKKDDKPVQKLILNFCDPARQNLPAMGNCLHVLDMYRKSLFTKDSHHDSAFVSISMTGTVTPTGTCTGTGTVTGTGTGTSSGASRQDRSTGPRKGARDAAIPITRSATELDEAGVLFKRNKQSQSITDISFEGGLTGVGNVIHLARRIIRNFIGSDKAAANLFNTISKDVTIDPTSRLGSVHSDVSQYCEKQLNRWRANLIHTYFTNPRTAISVVAAGVLFGLTIAQTVYSILQYY
ncbi:unnamed protein product [Ilex paraguariensis]|uniref:Uncharacterized protein n=1 Tax=Ilex paraguariensis TaxID=185542 RepID=A0ABC8SZQ7_9AQUA